MSDERWAEAWGPGPAEPSRPSPPGSARLRASLASSEAARLLGAARAAELAAPDLERVRGRLLRAEPPPEMAGLMARARAAGLPAPHLARVHLALRQPRVSAPRWWVVAAGAVGLLWLVASPGGPSELAGAGGQSAGPKVPIAAAPESPAGGQSPGAAGQVPIATGPGVQVGSVQTRGPHGSVPAAAVPGAQVGAGAGGAQGALAGASAGGPGITTRGVAPGPANGSAGWRRGPWALEPRWPDPGDSVAVTSLYPKELWLDPAPGPTPGFSGPALASGASQVVAGPAGSAGSAGRPALPQGYSGAAWPTVAAAPAVDPADRPAWPTIAAGEPPALDPVAAATPTAPAGRPNGRACEACVAASPPEPPTPTPRAAPYQPRAIREFLRVDWARWEERELPAAVARMVATRDAPGLLAALDDLTLDSSQADLLRLRGDLRAQARRCAAAQADSRAAGLDAPACP